MTKSCLQFHELAEEAGMPSEDQKNYLAVAEELVEYAVKRNPEITAQEIAKMVTECCSGAIALYLDEESDEDQEFAKEMVVEEIVEAISETVEAVKNEIKMEEDLDLFEKYHLFEGDFEDERFPVNNFSGKVKIEKISIIEYGKKKGRAQFLITPDGEKKSQIITGIWFFENIKTQEENKLEIVSNEKFLNIQCKNKEELDKLLRYIKALIIEAESKVKKPRKTREKVTRDFGTELRVVEEKIREAYIDFSKWEDTIYDGSPEGEEQKEKDRKLLVDARVTLQDEKFKIELAMREKEDKERIFGIKS